MLSKQTKVTKKLRVFRFTLICMKKFDPVACCTPIELDPTR